MIGSLPAGYLLPFVVDVPEEWRGQVDMNGDSHATYRSYLRVKYAAWGDKAWWTNATRPAWLGSLTCSYEGVPL